MLPRHQHRQPARVTIFKEPAMTPMELRNKVIEAKKAFGRNEITVDELNAIADKYIEALKKFKKDKKAKITIPSRAYLIRAL